MRREDERSANQFVGHNQAEAIKLEELHFQLEVVVVGAAAAAALATSRQIARQRDARNWPLELS